jgi:hypothetical protein
MDLAIPMYRVLTKFVVAALVILGDGLFASESSLRVDDCPVAHGGTILLSPPALQDDAGSGRQLPVCFAGEALPDIYQACQSSVLPAVPVPELLAYHPFNPRAPPVPAT